MFFLVLVVVTGATYSIVQKWQNETKGYKNENFDHPYFQSFVVTFGEMLSFVVYFIK